MLMHNKLEEQDSRIGGIRSQMQHQFDSLGFAGRLWQLFRAIVFGTLHEIEIQATLGCSVDTVMQAIDERVREFIYPQPSTGCVYCAVGDE
jgi:hypothetical protein